MQEDKLANGLKYIFYKTEVLGNVNGKRCIK